MIETMVVFIAERVPTEKSKREPSGGLECPLTWPCSDYESVDPCKHSARFSFQIWALYQEVGGGKGRGGTSVGREEESKAGPVRVQVRAKAGLGWLGPCVQGPSWWSRIPVKRLMHRKSAPKVRRHLNQHLVLFEKTSKQEWPLERGHQVQLPLRGPSTDVATGDHRGWYLRPWFVSKAGCSGGN